MTRLLIAGDTHADTEHVRYLLAVAKQYDIKQIIQLGDWGFQWPGLGRLEELQALLKEHEIAMDFLDGNHENYPELQRLEFFGANHPCRIGPWLTYHPRGTLSALGGVRFAWLGGAVSIDRANRVPGASWWPEESIKLPDLDKLGYWASRFKVDVLLTHDTVDLPIWQDLTYDRPSSASRAVVGVAAELTQPDVIYHGHMHVRHTSPFTLKSGKVVRVEGLGCNGMGLDSWCILDTDDFRAQRGC